VRINIWGGPGTGKSTTAAWLFANLKQKGKNVELVTEYIKSWAWEGRVPSSYDQMYIFASQLHREDILTRRGVHIVTDSPIPLQLVYARKYRCPFFDELLGVAKKFELNHPSFNILLKRTVPFQTFGRYETLDEAKEIDEAILQILEIYGMPYVIRDPERDKEATLAAVEGILGF
jgi:tRNA uridine 5-carbamoylmethylation protein Kti12